MDKFGKRHESYFHSLPEARNWLEEARYADKHDNIYVPSGMTVDIRTCEILKQAVAQRNSRKGSEALSQRLEYVDRRIGKETSLVMRDLVFINWRTGEPAKNSSYDSLSKAVKLFEEEIIA